MKTTQLEVDAITVNGRHRKDLGDIDAMIASIEQNGLLQPILVTTDYKLIAGQRRLEAFKRMGKKHIDAVVDDRFETALAQLTAERDENTCRKDFTPSEAVAIGMVLEELERPKAKERQGRASQPRSEKISERTKGNTRDIVGAAVGMSGATYERARAVVKSGDESVIAEMDRTGKVTPAYETVRGIPTDYKGARHKNHPNTGNLRNKPAAKRTRLEQVATELREMANKPFQQVPVIQLRALVNELYELVFSAKDGS